MILKCPVCGCPLTDKGGSYGCCNNHSFDLSRKGALNLLMSSGKGKHHGDDKLMVHSRTQFLNRGYYDSLSDGICCLLIPYLPENSCIIDAGCGEGKYTYDLLKNIQNAGKSAEIIGVDISKDAISAMRSRTREVFGVVASVSRLPVFDSSADAVLNIFSPLEADEYRRILKDDGLLLRVIPGERHLIELKEAVYDTPYLNPFESGEINGFSVLDNRTIEYRVTMESNDDIVSLFQMTPYYYKTGRKDQEKLNDISKLSVTFSFCLFLYSKR